MLYREIIAVCSQIHTKHINTLCGQNVEFVNVEPSLHTVTTGFYSRGLCKQIRSVGIINRSGQRPVYLFSIQLDTNFMKDRNQRLQWIWTPIGLKWTAPSLHLHSVQYLLNTLYPAHCLLMTAIPVPVLYELPQK